MHSEVSLSPKWDSVGIQVAAIVRKTISPQFANYTASQELSVMFTILVLAVQVVITKRIQGKPWRTLPEDLKTLILEFCSNYLIFFSVFSSHSHFLAISRLLCRSLAEGSPVVEECPDPAGKEPWCIIPMVSSLSLA